MIICGPICLQFSLFYMLFMCNAHNLWVSVCLQCNGNAASNKNNNTNNIINISVAIYDIVPTAYTTHTHKTNKILEFLVAIHLEIVESNQLWKQFNEVAILFYNLLFFFFAFVSCLSLQQ